MIIALASQFHVFLPWGQCLFSLNSVLNVKALVGAFNKERAFIVKTDCETDGSFYSTSWDRSADLMQRYHVSHTANACVRLFLAKLNKH